MAKSTIDPEETNLASSYIDNKKFSNAPGPSLVIPTSIKDSTVLPAGNNPGLSTNKVSQSSLPALAQKNRLEEFQVYRQNPKYKSLSDDVILRNMDELAQKNNVQYFMPKKNDYMSQFQDKTEEEKTKAIQDYENIRTPRFEQVKPFTAVAFDPVTAFEGMPVVMHGIDAPTSNPFKSVQENATERGFFIDEDGRKKSIGNADALDANTFLHFDADGLPYWSKHNPKEAIKRNQMRRSLFGDKPLEQPSFVIDAISGAYNTVIDFLNVGTLAESLVLTAGANVSSIGQPEDIKKAVLDGVAMTSRMKYSDASVMKVPTSELVDWQREGSFFSSQFMSGANLGYSIGEVAAQLLLARGTGFVGGGTAKGVTAGIQGLRGAATNAASSQAKQLAFRNAIQQAVVGNKWGSQTSLMTMSAFATAKGHEQALNSGLSANEAAALTPFYFATTYMVERFIGPNRMLNFFKNPTGKAEFGKATSQLVTDLVTANKEAAKLFGLDKSKFLQSASTNAISKAVKKLSATAASIGEKVPVASRLGSIWVQGKEEGMEEMTEELINTLTNSAFDNIKSHYTGEDIKAGEGYFGDSVLSAEFLDGVLKAGFLGAIGGGFGGAFMGKGTKAKDDQSFLVNIVATGRSQEYKDYLYSMYRNGQLGATNLNAEGKIIEDGEISIGENVYNGLSRQIDAIEVISNRVDEDLKPFYGKYVEEALNKKLSILNKIVNKDMVQHRQLDTAYEFYNVSQELQGLLEKKQAGEQVDDALIQEKESQLEKIKSDYDYVLNPDGYAKDLTKVSFTKLFLDPRFHLNQEGFTMDMLDKDVLKAILYSQIGQYSYEEASNEFGQFTEGISQKANQILELVEKRNWEEININDLSALVNEGTSKPTMNNVFSNLYSELRRKVLEKAYGTFKGTDQLTGETVSVDINDIEFNPDSDQFLYHKTLPITLDDNLHTQEIKKIHELYKLAEAGYLNSISHRDNYVDNQLALENYYNSSGEDFDPKSEEETEIAKGKARLEYESQLNSILSAMENDPSFDAVSALMDLISKMELSAKMLITRKQAYVDFMRKKWDYDEDSEFNPEFSDLSDEDYETIKKRLSTSMATAQMVLMQAKAMSGDIDFRSYEVIAEKISLISDYLSSPEIIDQIKIGNPSSLFFDLVNKLSSAITIVKNNSSDPSKNIDQKKTDILAARKLYVEVTSEIFRMFSTNNENAVNIENKQKLLTNLRAIIFKGDDDVLYSSIDQSILSDKGETLGEDGNEIELHRQSAFYHYLVSALNYDMADFTAMYYQVAYDETLTEANLPDKNTTDLEKKLQESLDSFEQMEAVFSIYSFLKGEDILNIGNGDEFSINTAIRVMGQIGGGKTSFISRRLRAILETTNEKIVPFAPGINQNENIKSPSSGISGSNVYIPSVDYDKTDAENIVAIFNEMATKNIPYLLIDEMTLLSLDAQKALREESKKYPGIKIILMGDDGQVSKENIVSKPFSYRGTRMYFSPPTVTSYRQGNIHLTNMVAAFRNALIRGKVTSPVHGVYNNEKTKGVKISSKSEVLSDFIEATKRNGENTILIVDETEKDTVIADLKTQGLPSNTITSVNNAQEFNELRSRQSTNTAVAVLTPAEAQGLTFSNVYVAIEHVGGDYTINSFFRKMLSSIGRATDYANVYIPGSNAINFSSSLGQIQDYKKAQTPEQRFDANKKIIHHLWSIVKENKGKVSPSSVQNQQTSQPSQTSTAPGPNALLGTPVPASSGTAASSTLSPLPVIIDAAAVGRMHESILQILESELQSRGYSIQDDFKITIVPNIIYRNQEGYIGFTIELIGDKEYLGNKSIRFEIKINNISNQNQAVSIPPAEFISELKLRFNDSIFPGIVNESNLPNFSWDESGWDTFAPQINNQAFHEFHSSTEGMEVMKRVREILSRKSFGQEDIDELETVLVTLQDLEFVYAMLALKGIADKNVSNADEKALSIINDLYADAEATFSKISNTPDVSAASAKFVTFFNTAISKIKALVKSINSNSSSKVQLEVEVIEADPNTDSTFVYTAPISGKKYSFRLANTEALIPADQFSSLTKNKEIAGQIDEVLQNGVFTFEVNKSYPFIGEKYYDQFSVSSNRGSRPNISGRKLLTDLKGRGFSVMSLIRGRRESEMSKKTQPGHFYLVVSIPSNSGIQSPFGSKAFIAVSALPYTQELLTKQIDSIKEIQIASASNIVKSLSKERESLNKEREILKNKLIKLEYNVPNSSGVIKLNADGSFKEYGSYDNDVWLTVTDNINFSDVRINYEKVKKLYDTDIKLNELINSELSNDLISLSEKLGGLKELKKSFEKFNYEQIGLIANLNYDIVSFLKSGLQFNRLNGIQEAIKTIENELQSTSTDAKGDIEKRRQVAEYKLIPIHLDVVDKSGNRTGEVRIKEYATFYGKKRLAAKTEEELKKLIEAEYDAELAALKAAQSPAMQTKVNREKALEFMEGFINANLSRLKSENFIYNENENTNEPLLRWRIVPISKNESVESKFNRIVDLINKSMENDNLPYFPNIAKTGNQGDGYFYADESMLDYTQTNIYSDDISAPGIKGDLKVSYTPATKGKPATSTTPASKRTGFSKNKGLRPKVVVKGEAAEYISKEQAVSLLSDMIGLDLIEAGMLNIYDGLIEHPETREKLWGYVHDYKIALSTINGRVNKIALRHEAFHFILDHIVSPSVRAQILDSAKFLIAKQDGLNPNSITEDDAHEFLANSFEDGKVNRPVDNSIIDKFYSFFRKLFNFFGYHDSIDRINSLFKAIDEGKFKDQALLGQTSDNGTVRAKRLTKGEKYQRLMAKFGKDTSVFDAIVNDIRAQVYSNVYDRTYPFNPINDYATIFNELNAFYKESVGDLKSQVETMSGNDYASLKTSNNPESKALAEAYLNYTISNNFKEILKFAFAGINISSFLPEPVQSSEDLQADTNSDADPVEMDSENDDSFSNDEQVIFALFRQGDNDETNPLDKWAALSKMHIAQLPMLSFIMEDSGNGKTFVPRTMKVGDENLTVFRTSVFNKIPLEVSFNLLLEIAQSSSDIDSFKENLRIKMQQSEPGTIVGQVALSLYYNLFSDVPFVVEDVDSGNTRMISSYSFLSNLITEDEINDKFLPLYSHFDSDFDESYYSTITNNAREYRDILSSIFTNIYSLDNKNYLQSKNPKQFRFWNSKKKSSSPAQLTLESFIKKYLYKVFDRSFGKTLEKTDMEMNQRDLFAYSQDANSKTDKGFNFSIVFNHRLESQFRRLIPFKMVYGPTTMGAVTVDRSNMGFFSLTTQMRENNQMFEQHLSSAVASLYDMFGFYGIDLTPAMIKSLLQYKMPQEMIEFFSSKANLKERYFEKSRTGGYNQFDVYEENVQFLLKVIGDLYIGTSSAFSSEFGKAHKVPKASIEFRKASMLESDTDFEALDNAMEALNDIDNGDGATEETEDDDMYMSAVSFHSDLSALAMAVSSLSMYIGNRKHIKSSGKAAFFTSIGGTINQFKKRALSGVSNFLNFINDFNYVNPVFGRDTGNKDTLRSMSVTDGVNFDNSSAGKTYNNFTPKEYLKYMIETIFASAVIESNGTKAQFPSSITETRKQLPLFSSFDFNAYQMNDSGKLVVNYRKIFQHLGNKLMAVQRDFKRSQARWKNEALRSELKALGFDEKVTSAELFNEYNKETSREKKEAIVKTLQKYLYQNIDYVIESGKLMQNQEMKDDFDALKKAAEGKNGNEGIKYLEELDLNSIEKLGKNFYESPKFQESLKRELEYINKNYKAPTEYTGKFFSTSEEMVKGFILAYFVGNPAINEVISGSKYQYKYGKNQSIMEALVERAKRAGGSNGNRYSMDLKNPKGLGPKTKLILSTSNRFTINHPFFNDRAYISGQEVARNMGLSNKAIDTKPNDGAALMLPLHRMRMLASYGNKYAMGVNTILKTDAAFINEDGVYERYKMATFEITNEARALNPDLDALVRSMMTVENAENPTYWYDRLVALNYDWQALYEEYVSDVEIEVSEEGFSYTEKKKAYEIHGEVHELYVDIDSKKSGITALNDETDILNNNVSKVPSYIDNNFYGIILDTASDPNVDDEVTMLTQAIAMIATGGNYNEANEVYQIIEKLLEQDRAEIEKQIAKKAKEIASEYFAENQDQENQIDEMAFQQAVIQYYRDTTLQKILNSGEASNVASLLTNDNISLNLPFLSGRVKAAVLSVINSSIKMKLKGFDYILAPSMMYNNGTGVKLYEFVVNGKKIIVSEKSLPAFRRRHEAEWETISKTNNADGILTPRALSGYEIKTSDGKLLVETTEFASLKSHMDALANKYGSFTDGKTPQEIQVTTDLRAAVMNIVNISTISDVEAIGATTYAQEYDIPSGTTMYESFSFSITDKAGLQIDLNWLELTEEEQESLLSNLSFRGTDIESLNVNIWGDEVKTKLLGRLSKNTNRVYSEVTGFNDGSISKEDVESAMLDEDFKGSVEKNALMRLMLQRMNSMYSSTKMFGARIPTTGKQSMSNIGLVEYLWESPNGLMVAEILMYLHGADRDLDKLRTIMFSPDSDGVIESSFNKVVKGNNARSYSANRIVEIIRNVMSSGKNAAEIFTPTNFSMITNWIESYEKLKEEARRQIPSDDFFEKEDVKVERDMPSADIKVHKEFFNGDNTVGVFAKETKIISYFISIFKNNKKPSINNGMGFEFMDKTYKFLNGYNRDEKDSDGMLLISNSSTKVQSSVDNAKHALLSKINTNKTTKGIYALMNMIGISLNDAMDFLNYPVIYEVVNDIINNDLTAEEYSNANIIIDKAIEKAMNQSQTMTPEQSKALGDLSTSMENIRKNMFYKPGHNPILDLAALSKLQELKKMNDYMYLFSQFIQLDQGLKANEWNLFSFQNDMEKMLGMSIDQFLNVDERRKVLAGSAMPNISSRNLSDFNNAYRFFDVYNAIDSLPHIKKSMERINQFLQRNELVFFMNSSYAKSLQNEFISKMFGDSYRFSTPKAYMQFLQFINQIALDGYIQNDMNNIVLGNVTHDLTTVYGRTMFAHEMADNLSLFKVRYPDNIFVDRLDVYIGQNMNYVTLRNGDSLNVSENQEAELIRAFSQLNESDQKLFYAYSLVTSNYGSQNKSFARFMGQNIHQAISAYYDRLMESMPESNTKLLSHMFPDEVSLYNSFRAFAVSHPEMLPLHTSARIRIEDANGKVEDVPVFSKRVKNDYGYHKTYDDRIMDINPKLIAKIKQQLSLPADERTMVFKELHTDMEYSFDTLAEAITALVPFNLFAVRVNDNLRVYEFNIGLLRSEEVNAQNSRVERLKNNFDATQQKIRRVVTSGQNITDANNNHFDKYHVERMRREGKVDSLLPRLHQALHELFPFETDKEFVKYYGEVVSEIGTAIHKMAEDFIISGETKVKKITLPNGQEINAEGFHSEVKSFVNDLIKKYGRENLRAEFRVVDSGTDFTTGVGLSIDILAFKKNGKVDKYDLKCSFSEYNTIVDGKPVISRSSMQKKVPGHFAQLKMQEYVLSNGDSNINRDMVMVDSSYIVPVHLSGKIDSKTNNVSLQGIRFEAQKDLLALSGKIKLNLKNQYEFTGNNAALEYLQYLHGKKKEMQNNDQVIKVYEAIVDFYMSKRLYLKPDGTLGEASVSFRPKAPYESEVQILNQYENGSEIVIAGGKRLFTSNPNSVTVVANNNNSAANISYDVDLKNVSYTEIKKLIAYNESSKPVILPKQKRKFLENEIAVVKGFGKVKVIYQTNRVIAVVPVNVNRQMSSTVDKNPSRVYMQAVVDRLLKAFPLIKAKYVTRKTAHKGYENDLGYVLDGIVYINLDNAKADTTFHEFAHIFVDLVFSSNPTLANIITEAVKTSAVFTAKKAEYSHLENEVDVVKEAFVTLIGEYLSEAYTENTMADQKSGVFQKINNALSRFFKSLISLLRGPSLSLGIKDTDIKNLTLESMVAMFGERMMAGEEISSVSSAQMAMATHRQMAPSVFSTVNSFIKSLINQPLTKPYSDINSFVDYKMRFSSGNSFKGPQGESIDFQSDKTDLDGRRNEILNAFKDASDSTIDFTNKIIDAFNSGNFESITDNISSLKDSQQIILNKIKNDIAYEFNPATDKAVSLSNYLGEDARGIFEENNIIVIERIRQDGSRMISLFDITYSNTARKNKGDKRIFAAYKNKSWHKNRNINLTASPQDAKKVMMTLAAMQIKSMHPKAKFHRLELRAIRELMNDKVEVSLNDVMPQLVKGIKELSSLFGPEINGLIENDMLNNPRMYHQSYLNVIYEHYKHKEKHQASSDTKLLLENAIESMDNGKLSDKQNELVRWGLAKLEIIKRANPSTFLNDPEYVMISQMIREVETRDKDYTNQVTDIDKIESYLHTYSALGSDIIQWVTGRLNDQLRLLRKYVIEDYKIKHDRLLSGKNGLMADFQRKVSDYFIENSGRAFEDMFVYHTLTDSEGKSAKVNTMTFITEESNPTEWNALSDIQKEYINFAVENIKKSVIDALTYSVGKMAAEEFYANNWPKGMLPVMHKRTSHILSEGRIKDALGSYMERNKFHEDIHVDDEGVTIPMSEFFLKQAGTHEFGSLMRLNMLGLDFQDGTLILRDSEKNSNILANVETVLDNFVVILQRKAYMDPVVTYINAAKAIAGSTTDENGNVLSGIVEYLNNFADRFLKRDIKTTFTKKYKSGELLFYNGAKALVASSIWFNLKSAQVNYAAGLFSTMASIAVTSVAKFVDPKLRANMPTFDDYLFSFKWMLKATLSYDKQAIDKIIALGTHFQLTDMDESTIATERFSKTDKRLIMFHGRAGMMLNFAGDYINRMNFLISVMKKDGSFDAFSVDENGIITYDESKDPRMEDKKYRDFIYQTLVAEGIQDPANPKLMDGYTNRQFNNIRLLADKQYGSYSKETQRNYELWGLAQMFGTMRRWMADKVAQYAKRGHYSDRFGEYEIKTFVDPQSGNVEEKYIWSPRWEEGVFNTLIASYHIFKEYSLKDGEFYKHLKPEQKENLIKFATDLLLLASAFVASGLLLDDDDDEKSFFLKAVNANSRHGNTFFDAFSDIYAGINPNLYLGVVQNPLLIVNRSLKLSSAMIDLIGMDFDSSQRKFLKLVPPIKNIQDFTK